MLKPQNLDSLARERHLTPSELAERWQTSTQTLANMRCRGVGPRYVKIGRLVRYRLADVEEYEHAQAQGGDAA